MRKTQIIIALAAMSLVGVTSRAFADTLVQNGMLSGGEGQQNHVVNVNQFDTQGGTLQLNFVQIDFLTSVIGGYETDGSGIPVDIVAMLSADWSLGGNPLAQTLAMVNTTVLNTTPGAASVFNTDTAQVFILPPDLSPWIGNGTIAMDAFTNFFSSEDPAGIISFGAGGTARWTVTYDYSVIPAPGSIAIAAIALLFRRRRRAV